MTGTGSGGAEGGGASSNGGSQNGGAGTSSGGASGASSGGSGDAALGKRIFDSGKDSSGQMIPRSGGIGMMGSSGCSSCHGVDGRGLSLMGLTAPDITYPNLTDPAGMIEPDGTRGPTYTDALILRAVVDGVGADGDALETVMPRWQLTDQEWADLLAYLKTLN